MHCRAGCLYRQQRFLLLLIHTLQHGGCHLFHGRLVGADNAILKTHRHRHLVCTDIMQHIQGIARRILNGIVACHGGNGADIQFLAAICQNQRYHVIVTGVTVNDYRYLFHSKLLLCVRFLEMNDLFPCWN